MYGSGQTKADMEGKTLPLGGFVMLLSARRGFKVVQ